MITKQQIFTLGNDNEDERNSGGRVCRLVVLKLTNAVILKYNEATKMAPSLWNCSLYNIWFFFSFLTSVAKDPAEEPCRNFECIHLQTRSQRFKLCNKVCSFSYVTSLISSVISTTLINNFFNKTWSHVIHFNKTRALPFYFDFIRVVSDYNGIHKLYFFAHLLLKSS